MYLKSLTKFQKTKIIISCLYNMTYVCTSKNKLQWKQAKSAAREDTESVNLRYLHVLEVLQQRAEKEGKDIISEWVQQSVEGEQI